MREATPQKRKAAATKAAETRRRKATTSNGKPETPPAELASLPGLPGGEPVDTPQVPPQQQPDGILVARVADAEGNVITRVQCVGNATIFEAETLLKLGLKNLRKQLFDE